MTPKFRVWLRKEKQMKPVRTIHFYPNGELDQVVPLDVEEFRNNPHYWPDPVDIEDVILMQSTGVLDDNGVEIYEGDVIIPDGGGASLVHWRDGAFQVGYYGDIPYVLADYKSLTVIGNIYENPELVSEFEEEANNERPRD